LQYQNLIQFLYTSRRRHTRSKRDWSSDVCSSDLTESTADGDWLVSDVSGARATKTYRCPGCDHEIQPGVPHVVAWPADSQDAVRSEERRVGKECESAWRASEKIG